MFSCTTGDMDNICAFGQFCFARAGWKSWAGGCVTKGWRADGSCGSVNQQQVTVLESQDCAGPVLGSDIPLIQNRTSLESFTQWTHHEFFLLSIHTFSGCSFIHQKNLLCETWILIYGQKFLGFTVAKICIFYFFCSSFLFTFRHTKVRRGKRVDLRCLEEF